MILNFILRAYTFIFSRTLFLRFNFLLYNLSLRGLGVLNFKNSHLSGETFFLKKYLSNKSGVIFDIGANTGEYSESILQLSTNFHIYAFEPHPITFNKLVNKLAFSNNVTLINQALSSDRDHVFLYDYASNDGSQHASLYSDVIKGIHMAKDVVSHEIETISLDEFIFDNSISEVVLLKIDTEGNELEVLKGCKNSISARKIKAIHFEFNEMNVSSKVFFRDFWSILTNYKIYRLLPHGMYEINSYSPITCEIFAYQNFVAILNE